MNTHRALSRWWLLAAILVPIIYFGAQWVAVPYFPDYNIRVHSASDLGSDRSSLPIILNTGAILTGVCGLFAAVGLTRHMRRVGVPRWLAYVVGACCVSLGLAAIWAGSFPMPDPRHNPGALGAGMFLMPWVMLLAFFFVQRANAMRVYLIANALGFIACAVVMSGNSSVDLNQYGGLFQKIIAVIAFVPVGAAGVFFLRK
jgi:hypothetical membrane protein